MQPNKFAGMDSFIFGFIMVKEGGESGKSIGIIR